MGIQRRPVLHIGTLGLTQERHIELVGKPQQTQAFTFRTEGEQVVCERVQVGTVFDIPGNIAEQTKNLLQGLG